MKKKENNLPEIIQWIKQTYACRYNVYDGRTGHTWGDRYWSKVLAGKPPEEEIPASGKRRAGECVEENAVVAGGQNPKAHPREGPPDGDSHREGKTAGNGSGPPLSPHHGAL